MARDGGDFGPGLKNAAAIAAPSNSARYAVRARRTRMPDNEIRVRPFSSITVAVEKFRARR